MVVKIRKFVSGETVLRIAKQAEFSMSYLVFMAMAGILAAVALLTSSVPILIGSMVIAPAFAPLALIAFAIVGRQPELVWRGIWIATVGLLVATLAAMLITWLLNVTNVIPPETNLLDKPLLEERVRPGWYSVAAAFAAGVAGTFALAKQTTDTLVGVVAALALVPAAAAGGVCLLTQDPQRAIGGFGLLGINVGLIILMGIVTLLLLRPDQKD
ncbi:DUF389 domain-containing protein [Pontibacter pamirensis]|uniref:DUF389 domain-containing protein n=1 Tax=Pontibacter pamirensis TaxID=2562824 RepID=UPI001389FFE0|nr:DUF389 domain-containing protein [Pontibacter pamirensis]